MFATNWPDSGRLARKGVRKRRQRRIPPSKATRAGRRHALDVRQLPDRLDYAQKHFQRAPLEDRVHALESADAQRGARVYEARLATEKKVRALESAERTNTILF